MVKCTQWEDIMQLYEYWKTIAQEDNMWMLYTKIDVRCKEKKDKILFMRKRLNNFLLANLFLRDLSRICPCVLYV